ncbi:MAG: hypothetical protein ABI478_10855 [Propionivibrio sp.]
MSKPTDYSAMAYASARPGRQALPWQIVVVGLAVAAGGIYWAAQPPAPDPVAEARRACLGAVLARLHDPDSAKFADASVAKTATGYTVGFTVRAKNGFGGVRTGFAACDIAQSGAVRSVSGP